MIHFMLLLGALDMPLESTGIALDIKVPITLT